MPMMLATRGAASDITRLVEAGYLFDLKIDGIRCVATVDAGEVGLVSRSGADITGQYPEVVAALLVQFPDTRVVLDGEIAVPNEAGYPDWSLTLKRNAQQRRATYWAEKMPAVFYAFDLLEGGGGSVRTVGYAARRAALETILEGALPLLTTTPLTDDGHTLWSFVQEHHLEGMIAKEPASAYRPGRSPQWVKIKRTQTVTCLVGGFEAGTGSRASTFGALLLYLLNDEGNLVQIGKVGSGFSNGELSKAMRFLHKPEPLVVEVEYLDFSPARQLRQPVFTRFRLDAALNECTLDQLISTTDLKGGQHD